VDREEPDFQMNAGDALLGIELTHVHPPPRNKSFPSPVAEAALYQRAVRRAEQSYAQIPGAVPVKVTAYPWNIERKSGNEKAMAKELVEFVCAKAHEANPSAVFERRAGLPRGFGVVAIARGNGPWFTGSAVTVTVEDVYGELRKRIAEKNERFSVYREHMPGARLWLLLYSGADVTNGIDLPFGFDQWSVCSDFDRLFFYSGLSNGVFEIQKGISLPAL
jgi:hypothetical protein